MRCPTCDRDNPNDARFCAYCGTGLVTSTAPGEERKLVTVLFADVAGSTRLSGAVDPEQVRAQMARFFEIAREEIHRFGGTVEKFIGDAVMAVFGLPVTHEDDPERAARAAASLQTRVRPEVETGGLPEIRIGINTGEVVANPQATDKGEFLVTGEVVNLAARLQQHAEPGQVLLGERTVRGLRDIAQVCPVPQLTVKGAADPLPAWELLEVAPPQERTVRATPFVGRAEELDLLHGHVGRMRREGRGYVITILGPAGVGKTRLVQELRARTEAARILRGRALPYGTGVPFWALGEVIREDSGILMGDPLEVARQKLQDAAARLQVSDAAPALLAVLGLGADGHGLTREVLFYGMRIFFQALARRAPLLMILEDVHSAEDVTLDFFEHMTDWVREVPLLLLMLSRPELLERRPTWMGGKHSATTLFLDPLPSEESRELVLGILGGKPAPDPLVEQVLERAEGNPLFVEEMLRALLDRGVLTKEADRWALTVPLAQMAIPDTVHAVIAARVDALPGPEKHALQTAAVMGKDFWVGAVRFIAGEPHVDEALWALVGKDLLVHKQRSTLQGEEECTFRHILIRDIAYAMLPKAQRWQGHARCAEWMHRIAGDRQAEYADLIAYHWLQVIVLRQDLGLPPDARAREQARSNLLLAGDRAAGLYANMTALDHYTRALELEPPPSERLQALLDRGEVWMLLGQYERAREDFASVRVLAQETEQPRWEAFALDHLGHSHRQQDQLARALEHLELALTLSRKAGDPSLTGRILNHLGVTYYSDARHEEAIRSHQEARQLLEDCGDVAGLGESLHGMGETSVLLGRFREGIEWLSESARISDQLGNRSLAGENQYTIAWSRKKLGEYAEAEAEVQRSMTALAEIGDVWNSAAASGVAAEIAAAVGEFATALERATRGLGLARQIGAVRLEIFNLLALGLVYRELEDSHSAWRIDLEAVTLSRAGRTRMFLMPSVLASMAADATALGRTDEAWGHIEEARRILAERPRRLDFPEEVTHAEGRVLLALGRAAEAREAAARLSELVEATGTLHWRAPAMLLLADATAVLGDSRAAVPVYAATAEEAERMKSTPALWRAFAGLAEAQRALGRAQESAASAERAREIIDRLAATVSDARLRATFLQSAKVQRVAALTGA